MKFLDREITYGTRKVTIPPDIWWRYPLGVTTDIPRKTSLRTLLRAYRIKWAPRNPERFYGGEDTVRATAYERANARTRG